MCASAHVSTCGFFLVNVAILLDHEDWFANFTTVLQDSLRPKSIWVRCKLFNSTRNTQQIVSPRGLPAHLGHFEWTNSVRPALLPDRVDHHLCRKLSKKGTSNSTPAKMGKAQSSGLLLPGSKGLPRLAPAASCRVAVPAPAASAYGTTPAAPAQHAAS